jgi:uncharacterized Zn finger protein
MAGHKNAKQLFKRLIKAAQRTAEQSNRSENHYFRLLLRTMTLFPWVDCQDEHLRTLPDQTVAAAEFAKRLTQAKNFQEFARMENAFIRRIMDDKEFVQETTKAEADSVKTAFPVSDGTTHVPLL